MFTKLGRIASYLAVALGLGAIIGAFIVAPDIYAPDFDRADMRQSSLWMKEGATLAFLGLVLGVLCEISAKLSLGKAQD